MHHSVKHEHLWKKAGRESISSEFSHRGVVPGLLKSHLVAESLTRHKHHSLTHSLTYKVRPRDCYAAKNFTSLNTLRDNLLWKVGNDWIIFNKKISLGRVKFVKTQFSHILILSRNLKLSCCECIFLTIINIFKVVIEVNDSSHMHEEYNLVDS